MSSPTLIIGDGNWAVKSGSLLGYEYGELSGQFAPIPITGSRASIATYTNSSGLIVSASSGVLRVDYSTGTGSLLLEPQRTNLALNSEDLTNANWAKINTSVTANTTTSPDGTTNADTLIADGTSNQHYIAQAISGDFTSGSSYSYTIYAKKNTNNFIQLWIPGALGGMFANFDLNSGVVGTLGNTSGTNPTSTIQSVGSGWYRCNMTFVPTSTGASGMLIAITSNASSARAESNSLSTSVFLWGGQLEAGAYPTTYIPTIASTVTRLVDSFNRSNIYTDGVITSGGGTWLVELLNNVVMLRDASDVGLFIGNSSNGVTGDCLIIRNNGSNTRIVINKRIAGTQTSIYTTTTDTVKIAIKWNGTTADVFANGTKVVSATAFAATNMEFFRGTGGDVTKYITQNKFYNQPLSDAECISLTTL